MSQFKVLHSVRCVAFAYELGSSMSSFTSSQHSRICLEKLRKNAETDNIISNLLTDVRALHILEPGMLRTNLCAKIRFVSRQEFECNGCFGRRQIMEFSGNCFRSVQ